MRCAPRQAPERAGEGYQRDADRRPSLSTTACTATRPPSEGGRRPRSGDPYSWARAAWCVRTRAAVTAASAITAASAAAGNVVAGEDDEASRVALRSSKAAPFRPASWPKTGPQTPS